MTDCPIVQQHSTLALELLKSFDDARSMSTALDQSTQDVPSDNGTDDATLPGDTPSATGDVPARPPVEDDDEDDEEEEEEEKEPNLKYIRLTSSVASLYRNGDSTSAFAVTGDKMVRNTARTRTSVKLTNIAIRSSVRIMATL